MKTDSLADLPDIVPVFPLPGAVLLPRTRLPLNIFEPRYLAMLDDVLANPSRMIGMVQPRSGPGGQPGAQSFHAIGCAGRLVSFSETEDGRYMITLAGVSRFRIQTVEEGFTPYLKARVEWSDFSADLGGKEQDPGFDRAAFFRVLEQYFTQSNLTSDWETMKQADTELLINSLSMLLPFEEEEKQALLEAPHLTERRQTLQALMEFSMATGGGDEGALQ
ncbi:LON peptidase substrate-binding domain-containing protein [Oceanomicrobium pacificus]|uniref:ATP-dependent protease n=1 Tax=Oceanomicrobium pacificus TaxID=2692916 RepID=A0A6B0TLP2_9RHOB|nr:LON peptidase substrate-binding domain-containing protein [Oceanomicrobium pacificus]MXU64816.1 ATP-dependent protease [Oceanomicrobium pacificus]